MPKTRSDLKAGIVARIGDGPARSVWTPADFLDLGGRDAVDKTLQRLVAAGGLRRIDRGLYDRPIFNRLTRELGSPDPRGVIDAVARRDQRRVLVDGMDEAWRVSRRPTGRYLPPFSPAPWRQTSSVLR
jgi:hypothetical protein